MSNQFAGQGRKVGDLPRSSNSGPKRGIGPGPGEIERILSTLPQPKYGPKRGLEKSSYTNNSSSLSNSNLVTSSNKKQNSSQYNSNAYKDMLNKQNDHKTIDPTISNSGPKRGVGYGPGAIYHTQYVTPNEGPRKGIGYGPGAENLTFTNRGATPEDNLCLQLVNKFRKENGLPPLMFNKSLATIAMSHSMNMLQQKVPFGHSGFEQRAQKAKMISVGENVGYCHHYSNPIQILVEGWINSPPHRKNLLGNFTYLGTAFAHNGDLWYGTQLFGLV